jgi:hypothetical protein
MIIKEKKKIKYFYLILDGKIRITKFFDIFEIDICQLSKSSVFGESFLIYDCNSKFNYK